MDDAAMKGILFAILLVIFVYPPVLVAEDTDPDKIDFQWVKLHTMSRQYDPLHFPLLDPDGPDANGQVHWFMRMLGRDREYITRRRNGEEHPEVTVSGGPITNPLTLETWFFAYAKDFTGVKEVLTPYSKKSASTI